jgi:putative ABC transport system permease protein
VLEGRNFSQEFTNDQSTVLFNESAVEMMGFEDLKAALDQDIFFWGDTFKIVGVVKDYHQESLKADFDPLIFRCLPASRSYYSLKVETNNISETIAHAQAVWDDIFPGNPFEYFFLDDHFNRQYQADLRFGKVFGFFAGLAIFVACLGLFGLSSFMATQRTKEIGVRKVLGASIASILALLSKDFVKLILAACVISIPIAYLILQNWLHNYAFHIDLSWWLFVLPMLAVLFIAIFTVSFQSLKAALANPVDTLRDE